MSRTGPMTKKAITGAMPKVPKREEPIKASASLQRESRKLRSIKMRMATKGLLEMLVRMRVGT